MVVCGIEISGSEARIVILNGTKNSYTYRNIKPKKLTLEDGDDQANVKAFRDTIFTYFLESNIDLIVIKKRNSKGDYAGGPTGFKLEGIIQLYEGADVQLISPQSIAASKKKYHPAFPKELLRYQEAAFDVAFAALQ